MKAYEQIAQSFMAYLNCSEREDNVYLSIHEERIYKIVKRFFPSGSGFDSGTEFDFNNSKPEKLIFKTAFHHMNDMGYYVGWSDHTLIVTPSFVGGFDIRCTGRNVRDIKVYIEDCFVQSLNETIDDITAI